eukprot:1934834-Rhodomonas_salina.8
MVHKLHNQRLIGIDLGVQGPRCRKCTDGCRRGSVQFWAAAFFSSAFPFYCAMPGTDVLVRGADSTLLAPPAVVRTSSTSGACACTRSARSASVRRASSSKTATVRPWTTRAARAWYDVRLHALCGVR